MSFELGLKVVYRLVDQGEAFTWHQAKLSTKLFKGVAEKEVFEFVNEHVIKFQSLPKIETLVTKFPELKGLETPEPAKYYVSHLEQRHFYDVLHNSSTNTQELLKAGPHNIAGAKAALVAALNEITEQQYRHRIMDFVSEGKKTVLDAYHNMTSSKNPPAAFGWPYMDDQSGGMLPGDVVSLVGRPAMGKSQNMMYMAEHNWRAQKRNVLLVSMEMNNLAVAQRLAAMYAKTNLTQLKVGGFSTATLTNFGKKMSNLEKEPSKLYVVDGNLAACAEDLYSLAEMLACTLVGIDGAYLLRHKNPRLDRYQKVAENVELMKRFSTDLDIPTFASWQFARTAVKDKGKKVNGKPGLEDIGYTDAIGQISSIVLGLNQAEGVETMNSRVIEVMKGRNGETGEFSINWDWNIMDFSQIVQSVASEYQQLSEETI